MIQGGAVMHNVQNNIARRMKELRQARGISQEKLASLLQIPRPAVSQLENGKRELSTVELAKLTKIFNISADVFLDIEKEPEIILQERKEGSPQKSGIRINVPQKNLKKFKEVLLYILNKVSAKPNIGETVIYKLLYFIDFDYYEKYEEQLMGAAYIKNNYGPTPVGFNKIIGSMIKNKEIEKVKSDYYQYPQTKYLPLKTPDLSILNANEIRLIDDVLNRLSDMNASQISDYSHNDVPWITTDDQKVIEYEKVFYRTPQYSVREYGE